MEGIEGGEKREKIYNYILMKNKVKFKNEGSKMYGFGDWMI